MTDETNGDVRMPSDNEITVSWGDMSVTVSGDEPLDDIEDRVFNIIDRLKDSLNSGEPYRDVSCG